MKPMMNRRKFLGTAVFGAGAWLALPSWAMTEANAEAFVGSAIRDLEGLINSGKSGPALESSVRVFFNKYADVPSVARAVIGAPWRGMSDEQKRAYVAAFEAYVVSKYADQFGELQGGKAQITRSQDGGKAGVLVSAEFVKSGRAPIIVAMQVSDQSGSPKILDLRLKNVSMISTEREQVRQFFNQNGNDIDALISRLQSS